jgi:DNA polymerase-3 subunit gamma/tau
LKTLEEPPRHAVIVLATTEYEKLPPTITSRTQRFPFKKLGKTDIIKKLSAEAKEEKIKIDKPALELIAAAAEGSFRDAESLLDQIASLQTDIDLAAVERITGRIGIKKIHAMAECIVKKDLVQCLAHVAELGDEGYNLVIFVKDLIHYLRKALSIKIDPSLATAFEKELTRDEIVILKKLAAETDPAFLVKFLSSLIHAYSEMRYSPFAAVPLEVMLVENMQ